MTQPQPCDPVDALAPPAPCWIELEALVYVPQVTTDTYYGMGVGYGSYPPVDPANLAPGSARYDALNGTLQVWNGTAWVDQQTGPGDEYVDLNTGVVYSLTPSIP